MNHIFAISMYFVFVISAVTGTAAYLIIPKCDNCLPSGKAFEIESRAGIALQLRMLGMAYGLIAVPAGSRKLKLWLLVLRWSMVFNGLSVAMLIFIHNTGRI